jgi:hypothetical protein
MSDSGSAAPLSPDPGDSQTKCRKALASQTLNFSTGPGRIGAGAAAPLPLPIRWSNSTFSTGSYGSLSSPWCFSQRKAGLRTRAKHELSFWIAEQDSRSPKETCSMTLSAGHDDRRETRAHACKSEEITVLVERRAKIGARSTR